MASSASMGLLIARFILVTAMAHGFWIQYPCWGINVIDGWRQLEICIGAVWDGSLRWRCSWMERTWSKPRHTPGPPHPHLHPHPRYHLHNSTTRSLVTSKSVGVTWLSQKVTIFLENYCVGSASSSSTNLSYQRPPNHLKINSCQPRIANQLNDVVGYIASNATN